MSLQQCRWSGSAAPAPAPATRPPCAAQAGRNVVVTGGTRGLGAVQADYALHCGAAHVTITGRRAADGGTPADGVRTAKALAARHGADRVSYVQSDVRSDRDARSLFDPEARAAAGLPRAVHAASLNAGIFGAAGPERGIDTLATADFEKVMATNCTGVFRGMREFTRAAAQTGAEEPSLLLIKSIYGSGGSVFSNAGYQASKFCVDGLTKQGAVELARRGVTVNSLSPGFVKTPLTEGWWSDPQVDTIIAQAHPKGQWVDPESIGQTAAFLLHAPRSVTGVDVFVDHGSAAESIPNVRDGDTVRELTDEPCCGKAA